MKFVSHVCLIGLTLLVLVSQAEAKQGEFALSLSAGTGLLAGYTGNDRAPSSSFAERNPTLLDLDFQYEVTDIIAPSVRVEMTMEGGSVLTIVPNVVFDSNGDTVSWFGRVGIAIRTEPNYYGLDVGGGLIWHFLDHLGLVAELNVEPLFLGDGLKGIVVPLLVFVGFRGNV